MPDPRVILSREQDLERAVVTRGLRVGVLFSAALIVAGMTAWILGGQPVLRPFNAWGTAADPNWRHPAGLLLSAGLLGLVLTPVLRVILLAWVYARLRDFTFLAVSLGVLALLLLSALLGGA